MSCLCRQKLDRQIATGTPPPTADQTIQYKIRLVIYCRICVGTRIRSQNSDSLLISLLSKIRDHKLDTKIPTVDDQPYLLI